MRHQHNSKWWQQAKCVGQDPKKWDLLEQRIGDGRDARARAVCRGCTVMADCAADALEPLAVGTVRGGVWIPTAPGNGSRSLAIEKLMGVIDGA